MNKVHSRLGEVSMFGTFGLITLIAWQSDAFGLVTQELTLLLSGKVQEITENHTTFLMMLPVIFAALVLELPCVIIAARFQEILLGKIGGHALSDLLGRMDHGFHFFKFFLMVSLEELYARWFFLGVLTKIPFLSGTIAFYALFFIGNGLWALQHLKNFRRKEDRHALRVLPQFIAGIFYAYIFVKYGLIATILTHFASNAVLFATRKAQRPSSIDGLILGYSLLCALISYTYMDKPMTDILPWFADSPVFHLEGWTFGDYVAISIFCSSCLTALFGLLLYDNNKAQEKPDSLKEMTHYLIGIPFTVGAVFLVYTIVGLFIPSTPHRIIVTGMPFLFLHVGASPNAVARSFWNGLPNAYLTICILQALGFWLALGWTAIDMIVQAPRIFLNKQRE